MNWLSGIPNLRGLGDPVWQQTGAGGNPFDEPQSIQKIKTMSAAQLKQGMQFAKDVANIASELDTENRQGITTATTDISATKAQFIDYAKKMKAIDQFTILGMKNKNLDDGSDEGRTIRELYAEASDTSENSNLGKRDLAATQLFAIFKGKAGQINQAGRQLAPVSSGFNTALDVLKYVKGINPESLTKLVVGAVNSGGAAAGAVATASAATGQPPIMQLKVRDEISERLASGPHREAPGGAAGPAGQKKPDAKIWREISKQQRKITQQQQQESSRQRHNLAQQALELAKAEKQRLRLERKKYGNLLPPQKTLDPKRPIRIPPATPGGKWEWTNLPSAQGAQGPTGGEGSQGPLQYPSYTPPRGMQPSGMAPGSVETMTHSTQMVNEGQRRNAEWLARFLGTSLVLPQLLPAPVETKTPQQTNYPSIPMPPTPDNMFPDGTQSHYTFDNTFLNPNDRMDTPGYEPQGGYYHGIDTLNMQPSGPEFFSSGGDGSFAGLGETRAQRRQRKLDIRRAKTATPMSVDAPYSVRWFNAKREAVRKTCQQYGQGLGYFNFGQGFPPPINPFSAMTHMPVQSAPAYVTSIGQKCTDPRLAALDAAEGRVQEIASRVGVTQDQLAVRISVLPQDMQRAVSQGAGLPPVSEAAKAAIQSIIPILLPSGLAPTGEPYGMEGVGAYETSTWLWIMAGAVAAYMLASVDKR